MSLEYGTNVTKYKCHLNMVQMSLSTNVTLLRRECVDVCVYSRCFISMKRIKLQNKFWINMTRFVVFVDDIVLHLNSLPVLELLTWRYLHTVTIWTPHTFISLSLQYNRYYRTYSSFTGNGLLKPHAWYSII